MPTALRVGPYRFYFYSYDCGEPRHMHLPRITHVLVTDDTLSVDLEDGRTIAVSFERWLQRHVQKE